MGSKPKYSTPFYEGRLEEALSQHEERAIEKHNQRLEAKAKKNQPTNPYRALLLPGLGFTLLMIGLAVMAPKFTGILAGILVFTGALTVFFTSLRNKED
ncbi:MAG: hypothetical protein KC910_30445 [Candidatus Eremiobacteraeota bacterium]|nr:hypothetical protein [Candidatus Eremiobacteraeota bacterium]